MTKTKKPRRVAVYARLSVSTEESVSIARQVEACTAYAEARGWEVALVATDDGVSATKNKPEDRRGWREILDSPERFEAVCVWKVDRLARRVLDFLHADEALQERGAALVAVEDPIDLTTAQGRAFATMLAVFGEMEAAAIAARVKAARAAIVKGGRRAGGRPPYGFRNVPNPDGPGFVLAHDPETIDVVRRMVAEALEGRSLYAIARGLEADGIAPREHGNRRGAAHWNPSGVGTILRAPALAGMTPYTPDRKPGEDDRVEVLRDANGLPIVDEALAIITTEERRRLLALLDDAKRPGSRMDRDPSPALLSGIATCAGCGNFLHRASVAGGLPVYRCQHRDCQARASIARARVEEYVVARFLEAAGPLPVTLVEEVEGSDPAPRLAEIEAEISATVEALADTDDEDAEDSLQDRLRALKRARRSARAEETEPEIRVTETGRTFAETWALVEDVAERRDLLRAALDHVEIGRGRGFGPDRIRLRWHPDRMDVA